LLQAALEIFCIRNTQGSFPENNGQNRGTETMENMAVEESISFAMECDGVDLVQYLPYILQDFWELGTPAAEIIKIIRKHKHNYAGLNVLE
jgi:hypothetical protein